MSSVAPPGDLASAAQRRAEVALGAGGDTLCALGDVEARVALDALHCANIEVRAGEIGAGRLSVRVSRGDIERARRVWQRRLCARRRRLDLLLIGVGRVGGAFLEALSGRRLEALHLVGAADSRHRVCSRDGIDPGRVRRLLRSARAASEADAFGDYLLGHCEAAPVIVDATGSDEIAARHAGWLKAGIHVVTANKGAAANGWVTPWHRGRAFYGDTATVGAGLPVLRELRRLRAGGDRIESVEGILSGSLAYLFSALERGRSLRWALRDARRAGYVEPDPRTDLSGADAARKLAIVARAAGIDAGVPAPEPAVPAASLNAGEAAFREALPTLEAALAHAVQGARGRRRALRYVARLGPSGDTRIGPQEVPRESLLARPQGAENIFLIRSEAYSRRPLVIRGPGAGPRVTARAMLADLAGVVERCG